MAFRFDRFVLDPDNRRLTRDGQPVELNARYLDALALLVGEPGSLITKDRFLAEVWRGVPVTDEALTQCIRTLRRQLGDDAVRPRYIETVVKHGYRFIAPVEPVADVPSETPPAPVLGWRTVAAEGLAGTTGAGIAGLCGGLLYGFGMASRTDAGTGAVSVMLVILSLTVVIAVLGGAGVAFGIAAARLARPRHPAWAILGGLVGGALVGAVVKLLGLDAFNLLFGQAPSAITGAPEGAVLGAATGLGAWLAVRFAANRPFAVAVAIAALAGALSGLVISGLGGRLLGGSLALLGQTFPASRLHLDAFGALFGESGFGRLSRMITAGIEGALFAGGLVGATVLARQRLSASPRQTDRPPPATAR